MIDPRMSVDRARRATPKRRTLAQQIAALKPGLLGAIAAIMLALASPAIACSPSGIKIKQADWRPDKDGDFMGLIVGEVTNTCNEVVRVQMHFVFRDDSGKVTGVEDTGLGGAHISPQSDYAFSTMAYAGPGVKTMAATVQEVSAP
jgi:hypothetical protein